MVLVLVVTTTTPNCTVNGSHTRGKHNNNNVRWHHFDIFVLITDY